MWENISIEQQAAGDMNFRLKMFNIFSLEIDYMDDSTMSI